MVNAQADGTNREERSAVERAPVRILGVLALSLRTTGRGLVTLLAPVVLIGLPLPTLTLLLLVRVGGGDAAYVNGKLQLPRTGGLELTAGTTATVAVGVLAWLVVMATTIVIAASLLVDRPIRVRDALRHGIRRSPVVLGLGLLMAGVCAGVGLVAALALSALGPLGWVAVGAAFFVALPVLLWMTVALPAVVLEHVGPIEGIRQAQRVLQGRQFTATVVLVLMGAAFEAVAWLSTRALAPVENAVGLVDGTLGTLPTAVLAPYWAVVLTVLFCNRRYRNSRGRGIDEYGEVELDKLRDNLGSRSAENAGRLRPRALLILVPALLLPAVVLFGVDEPRTTVPEPTQSEPGGPNAPTKPAKPEATVNAQAMSSAPAPVSAAAPRGNALRTDWARRINSGPSVEVLPGLLGGNLIIESDDGLQAYDPTTGEPTWHYRESGRELRAYAVTGDALVLSFATQAEHGYPPPDHLVGLDVRTGYRRWQQARPGWSLTYDGVPSGKTANAPTSADAAAGVVPLTSQNRKTVLAVDAATGRTRWTTRTTGLEEDCAPPPAAPASAKRNATTALIPATVSCAARSGRELVTFLAIDATNGKVVWKRPVGRGAARVTTHRIRNGLTLWAGKKGTLLDRSGRRIAIASQDCESGGSGGSPCELIAAADRVVLLGGSGERTAVRVEDGRVLDRSGANLDRSSVPGKRGRILGLQNSENSENAENAGIGFAAYADVLEVDESAPRPKPLTLTDLRTGRTQTLTTGVGGAGHGNGTVEVGAVGAHRLFTLESTPTGGIILRARATAGTGRYAAFGGVAPTAWPDPCDLLVGTYPDSDDLGDADGDEMLDIPETPAPGGVLKLGGAIVPETTCSGNGRKIRIDWVAANLAQAKALYGRQGKPLKSADQATLTPGQERELHVRYGRILVTLTVDDGDTLHNFGSEPTGEEESMIEQVASNLRLF